MNKIVLAAMCVTVIWLVWNGHVRHVQSCERARAFHAFIASDTKLATDRQASESAQARELDRQAVQAWSVLGQRVQIGC